MKKVLFVGMVFGALALTSCKKDYKCTTEIAGVGDTEKFKDLDKDEAAVEKEKCESGPIVGTWSVD